MAAGIVLSRRLIGNSINYAVRLPGGTNAANAVYGSTIAPAANDLGTKWGFRLRHRPLSNNAQYLLSLSDGPYHFGIIRHYVANRYEIYGQTPSGTTIREALPVDTFVGAWYDVEFYYDGVTLRGYLNGVELLTKVLSVTAPSSGTNLTLQIGTVVPEYGSDHGDYDFAGIQKNGEWVARYQFNDGTGREAKEELARTEPVKVSELGDFEWIIV